MCFHLQGTNPPDAKAPEGEIWVDENAPKVEGATTTPTDTINIATKVVT